MVPESSTHGHEIYCESTENYGNQVDSGSRNCTTAISHVREGRSEIVHEPFSNANNSQVDSMEEYAMRKDPWGGESSQGSRHDRGMIHVDSIIAVTDANSGIEDPAELSESDSDCESSERNEGELSTRHCLVLQGPDDLLYIGRETCVGCVDGGQLLEPLIFAPSTRGTALGLTAEHIWMPPLPTTPHAVGTVAPGGSHLPSEALLNPYESAIYVRRKRAFIFLLLLGSFFYIFSFITGTVLNTKQFSDDSASSNLGYVSHSMLTSNDVSVAMAYLIMYLTLDMVGLAGALLDNGHLMMVYIVVETVLVAVFALRESLKPFIVFRLVIIMFAFQVRSSIVHIQILEQNMIDRALATQGRGQVPSPQLPRGFWNPRRRWPSARPRTGRPFAPWTGSLHAWTPPYPWRWFRPRRWDVAASPITRTPSASSAAVPGGPTRASTGEVVRSPNST